MVRRYQQPGEDDRDHAQGLAAEEVPGWRGDSCEYRGRCDKAHVDELERR